MITKESFRKLLLTIDFEKDGDTLFKKFNDVDAILKVDFEKKKLIYPEEKGLTVNSSDTCNFRANENFVVFECVNRLLEKGYKPEHLELEPKWQVGHGSSGGRADILVTDNTEKSLLIIECKTPGKEFNNAWKQTKNHPTQLFSYAQQEKSTNYICLYTSDFIDGEVTEDYYVVTLKDNTTLLEELKDKDPLSYEDANTVEEIWQAWDDTYEQDYSRFGIFEDDIVPYEIGKEKYTDDDLKKVSHHDIQGRYHQFATILRQHNVSGHENAFDKLVNLFLCKIVDESQNPGDLKFYWKGIAYDSPFELQDRLQKLYQAGMKEFLGEDVTYIDKQEIDDAFRFFKDDPDATKDTIKQYFRDLKFFTNNDFAFIDVHNERLFRENSAVLLQIVQMLQDIKLKTDEQNQFLGDMFEGFLDQGVKQSEGQFFTPMPIVKFILKSLPIEQLIKKEEDTPKVIDYACGAGHFLNEYATQIQQPVKKHTEKDINEYYANVTGIEKEYRLSKVAKVSSFMYGQDDINIIHADALGDLSDVKDHSFSLLVANPPYSVKGYLETLSKSERENFSLINAIDKKSYSTNNSIETFFLERAKQLLKPGGIAGIIVPSSVLTKGNSKSTSNTINVYVAARELLLKYFDIVGITALGSGTFGKTGTNTVTLFLRRKAANPAPADHFNNRISDWFKGNTDKDGIFKDVHLIKKYCDYLDYSPEDYKALLNGKLKNDLRNTETFKEYRDDFDNWSKIKNLKKRATFKAFSEEKRKEELESRFLTYVRRIEKDKLYYFVLAAQNDQQVVIVNSPTSTSKLKKFLGYEWSSAKGNEGIKYLGGEKVNFDESTIDKDDERILSNIANLNNIHTILYNPQKRSDPKKINYYIASNFKGNEVNLPEELQKHTATARLTDMLDFSRRDFDKAIDLTPTKKIIIDTKWDLKKISSIIDIIESGSRPKGGVGELEEGVLSLGGAHIHNCDGTLNLIDLKFVSDKFFNEAINGQIQKNDILICKDGALTGKIALVRDELNNKKAMANEHIFILRCDDKIKQLYIFNFLFSKLGQELLKSNITGSAQGGLNTTNLKNIKIPLPPKNVQKKITDACGAIDKEVEQAKQTTIKSKGKIEELVSGVYTNGYSQKKLSEIAKINPSKSQVRNLDYDTEVSFIEMASVSEEGYIAHKEDRLLGDVYSGSYKYFKEDDIILAKITPCMENGKCGIAVNLRNEIGFGSSEFHIIRVNEEMTSNRFVFAMLNREFVRKEAATKMTGSSGHRRVPVSFYKDYSIPVPKTDIQQKLVAEIGKLKAKMTEAREIIDNASEKKQQIIEKYL
jgi:type I restriction-modification system DNA methylase subunit/restriction endonuclease S subunit